MSDYWTENGIEKPQQVVVCAAIRKGKVIFCGARHCDKVMRDQAHAANTTLKLGEQGFINQFGEFLTRSEAMQVVNRNDQRIDFDRNGGDSSILYSEGLY